MTLYSPIKDYFTQEEVLSLDLSVKKNTDTTQLNKEELLKALCIQEKFADVKNDVLAVKNLLAQKGIQQCTVEDRKKLYEELNLPHFFMGQVELALGYSQEAIKYLTVAATQTDTLAARAAIDLGHLYYQEKNLNKAEESYKLAIAKNDENRSAHAYVAL
jgi:tetratricopeptide (TPR) repeat protein